MFTKNWYRSFGIYLYNSSAGGNVVGYDGSEWTLSTPSSDLFQIGSTNVSSPYCPTMYCMRTEVGHYTYGGVIIGDGDAAPTTNDYKLSGNIISTFAHSAAVTAEHVDDGVIVTGLYTITNTGTETITVKEIGLIATPTNNNGVKYRLLLERTVLDEPVTIPAGGIGQVTYTIRMNYPTA